MFFIIRLFVKFDIYQSMKRYILAFAILFFISSSHTQSQTANESCNLGFAFEISNDPNWGYNEPVIVDITPGSPAEKAGLQINDIILEVNGSGTFLKPYQTIMSWFNRSDRNMSISIRNFKTSFKTLQIDKNCRNRNAISEVQLAPVFSFYSLEDVQDRRFIIPVKTTTSTDASYAQYRTFDFVSSDESSRELDKRINAIFIRALGERGLVRDTDDPDFIIQTYYSYQSNPMFKPDSPTYGSYQSVWRFDTRNKRMVKLPVYNPSEGVRVDDIVYNIEFGYRFYDRKWKQPGEMTLIWEGEVTERLSENYPLLDYLEMNLPLLLLKFPYPGNLSFATYQVKNIKYNFTGIEYDINDLKTVMSVAPNSPAENAGIRPGDIILSIQKQSFKHTSKSLTQSYRQFISETMKYRDRSTQYTDSNGFKKCMFWDIDYYYNISETIKKKRYKSAFSYLFNFNQYIDWQTPETLNIEVDREGEKLEFDVKPIVKHSSHILVY